MAKKTAKQSKQNKEHYHHFDVLGLGYSLGTLLGVYMLFIGITSWLFGWGASVVELTSTWYRGFGPSFVGSIIGGLWGFVDGFVCGVLIAWLYNKYSDMRN